MSSILLGILNAQAAGGATAGGAYDLLETQTLDTATSIVSFSDLDTYSGYEHLQVRMVARSDRPDPNTQDYFVTTFDNDTNYGTNYTASRLQANAASTSSFTAGSTGTIYFESVPGADFGQENTYAGVIMDILDFNNTNKFTSIMAYGGFNSAVDRRIAIIGGTYLVASIPTSLELRCGSDNWSIGSKFALYGRSGA